MKISLVLNTEQGKFLIVRMKKLFPQGVVPPLNVVKNLVERRLMEEKRRDYLNDYIKELYGEEI